ncbi:MAG: hypothetical protein ACRED3_10425 [Bradyrhizobium sp.]
MADIFADKRCYRAEAIATLKAVKSGVRVILITSILGGCYSESGCASLDALRQANPVADATAANSRGNHTLLMLGGYVGTVPGFRGNELPDTLMLDGTSDVELEACRQLRPLGEAYALKYNETILAMKEATN